VDSTFFQEDGALILAVSTVLGILVIHEPCPVESISRALRVSVLLVMNYIGHESLQLFSSGLSVSSCVLHHPASCTRTAGGNSSRY
jgi:hypothetical protein